MCRPRRRRGRRRPAGLVLLFCAVTVVTVLTALTAGPRQTLGFALLTVVFLGWSIPYGNLQHRRLRRMRSALAGHRREPGPADGTPRSA
ncbi:hypothetical protein ACWER6_32335 [Streptomyces sp. NPDC004009]